MIITYIILSSIICTGAFAVGLAQRRERRRLVTMSQSATIPHRPEQPISEIASLRMELRRHKEWLGRTTEPEEAPRFGAVARPGEEAAGVELAVAGIEPAPHHAGR